MNNFRKIPITLLCTFISTTCIIIQESSRDTSNDIKIVFDRDSGVSYAKSSPYTKKERFYRNRN